MNFICGPICSGKSFYGSILSKSLGVDFVDVSSIVKKLLNTDERSKLQDSSYLDSAIISELKKFPPDSVIAGVRQVSILKAFADNSSFIWLNASREIRYKRCLERKDKKDILTFEAFLEAEKKDNLLGLSEVKIFILNRKD